MPNRGYPISIIGPDGYPLSFEDHGNSVDINLEVVAAAINSSADKLTKTLEKIAEKQMVASRENTIYACQTLVSGFLQGSGHINQGLQAIASEIRQYNFSSETRYLAERVEYIERWLFEHQLLQDFYKTCNLKQLQLPLVDASNSKFLDKVCRAYNHEFPMKEFNMTAREKFEFSAGIHDGRREDLRNLSLNMMCHPLIALAHLVVEDGLDFGDGGTIVYIRGSYFNWNSYYFRGLDLKSITFEEALKLLSKVAEECESDKKDVLLSCYKKQWDDFFVQLNRKISQYNLQVLAQCLEEFMRKKRIEMYR